MKGTRAAGRAPGTAPSPSSPRLGMRQISPPPLGKVSQGRSHCQPGFLGSQPSTPQLQPCPPSTLGPSTRWREDWGSHYPPPQPPLAPCPPACPQPRADHISLNAFLLNSYKIEYKILASTSVIKENFSSAVSSHLVHTVKCWFFVGGVFFFLGFFFFLWFFFIFIFVFQPAPV